MSVLVLPWKVYAKCLEKWCSEIIEPKLENTQCCFRPGRSTTDQICTFEQIFEICQEYANDVYTWLSTSRKHATGFLMKKFWECCRSTVLTATSYWPSSHCISTQKFVSVLITTVHRGCWSRAGCWSRGCWSRPTFVFPRIPSAFQ